MLLPVARNNRLRGQDRIQINAESNTVKGMRGSDRIWEFVGLAFGGFRP